MLLKLGLLAIIHNIHPLNSIDLFIKLGIFSKNSLKKRKEFLKHSTKFTQKLKVGFHHMSSRENRPQKSLNLFLFFKKNIPSW